MCLIFLTRSRHNKMVWLVPFLIILIFPGNFQKFMKIFQKPILWGLPKTRKYENCLETYLMGLAPNQKTWKLWRDLSHGACPMPKPENMKIVKRPISWGLPKTRSLWLVKKFPPLPGLNSDHCADKLALTTLPPQLQLKGACAFLHNMVAVHAPVPAIRCSLIC